MRTLFCAVVLSLAASFTALAKPAPLTVKEVSLMLRTGYSASAVEAELARRHFMESVDATAEKTLLAAGATPALIAALRSGAYTIPPEQVAAAQAELDAQAKRKALQAEESRQMNTLYQAKLAQERAAAATAPAATGNKVADLVKGDLVTSKNGILQVVNDQAFEKKKLIALYFSGRWCPSCRKFTPELVDYYNRVAAAHPEFEVVFVSSDRSAPAMEEYMRDTKMPWPAVKYEKIAEKEELKKYAGSGIPCLVLVDASGKVISDSYAGKTYLGPSKVLRDLDQLFAGRAAAAAPVAQR
jgi:nucleoredoxin